MKEMKATADLVKHELEHDLYLLEILKDGLVNVSALARKLLPGIKSQNPKATIESISIAARRYLEAKKKQRISEKAARIIAGSQLFTKNDVVHLTFKRNDAVLQRVNEVSKRINWGNEEIFLINQGSGEVTIILDKKNEHMFDACSDYMIESTENLTIISVQEVLEKGMEKSIDVPGIYAYFTSQLARRGINIISVISTYTQITFAFEMAEFVKAYETLNECITYFRSRLK